MTKKIQKGRPAGPSLSKHNDQLEKVILQIMNLQDLFKKIEPLFCNPTHYEETQNHLNKLRWVYEELREYVDSGVIKVNE